MINENGGHHLRKILTCAIIGVCILFNSCVTGLCIDDISVKSINEIIVDDIDPLVDICVTVDIISIRLFNITDNRVAPDFFVSVSINSEEYTSNIWENAPYLYDIHWTAIANVPDEKENVSISIILYQNTTCSKDSEMNTLAYPTHLIYSIKNGHWSGDDTIGDPSGYGRLNSYDTGNTSQYENEYELWFDINQTDFDNDTIPYWTEVNVYGTNPLINNTGDDLDNDSIPVEWEHKWKYNPNVWENHMQFDSDNDSLTNVEEYQVSSWDSDPFRKDIYIEMDAMAIGPHGQNSTIPLDSKELLRSVYNRRDIVYHLDDGCMGGGGEIYPFDLSTDRKELLNLYTTYFLHNDSQNWRRSVFRYATIVYQQKVASGIAYVGEHPWLYWHVPGINTFVISAQSMQKTSQKRSTPLDFIYSCAIMHETGHTFGIDFLFPIGCDNIFTTKPYHIAYWFFENYKSCMNYRYTYSLLDYSDGSHGIGDSDDWGQLDFSFFEKNW